MPRHADPVQRRRQVAEALFRVVDAEGLDAASLPRIARELGATTGLVQTYFASKDELLAFAVEYLGQLVRTRVADAVQDSGDGDLCERLVRGMSVLASADEREHDIEGRIWLAFLARAVVHDQLRALHVAGAREIRIRCEQVFAAARAQGQLAADVDAQAAAVALAAFGDGLALHRALEPDLITKERARTLLREYLGRLFERHADHGEGQE